MVLARIVAYRRNCPACIVRHMCVCNQNNKVAKHTHVFHWLWLYRCNIWQMPRLQIHVMWLGIKRSCAITTTHIYSGFREVAGASFRITSGKLQVVSDIASAEPDNLRQCTNIMHNAFTFDWTSVITGRCWRFCASCIEFVLSGDKFAKYNQLLIVSTHHHIDVSAHCICMYTRCVVGI